MALVECHNFRGSRIKISAPGDSPNTDGIHIERSSSVDIERSRIGTGDDCISIGQGNSQVTISSISCGPGHGIRYFRILFFRLYFLSVLNTSLLNLHCDSSVGSLGKYLNERDVSGLVVRDCYMTGTSNGIRIKTWPNSPGSSAATNMTFDNIVMNNVSNPIIIDQSYCPSSSCSSEVNAFPFSSFHSMHFESAFEFFRTWFQEPSRVKLSDIHFKNIRGTSSSEVAVSLGCSKGVPCQNVYVEDVHLDLSSRNRRKSPTAFCSNVRAKFIGTQVPPPCS